MRGKVDVETVMEVCEPLLLNFTTLQCLERKKKVELNFLNSTCKRLCFYRLSGALVKVQDSPVPVYTMTLFLSFIHFNTGCLLKPK